MALTSKDRVNLGPLTTIFTPPAPCTIAVGLCATCDVAWWGQTCAPTTVEDDPGCWPSTTDGVPEPTRPLDGWGFYSPGLECPAGYTSACTAVAGQSASWKVQFDMLPEETFVGCCPTGFKCDNLNGQTCLMGAKRTSLPTVSCETGASNNFGFTTLPNAKVTVLNLFAPMIQLAFQSSDRTGLTTTSPSTATASSSRSTTRRIPSTVTTAPSAPPSTLAPAAIAGIAVGACAILIFLVISVAILIWRRRRGDRPTTANPPPSYSAGQQEPKQFTQYSAGGTAELGAGHDRAEVPGEGAERFAGRGIGGGGTGGRGEVVEMPGESYR